jgi:hypothetical protein
MVVGGSESTGVAVRVNRAFIKTAELINYLRTQKSPARKFASGLMN